MKVKTATGVPKQENCRNAWMGKTLESLNRKVAQVSSHEKERYIVKGPFLLSPSLGSRVASDSQLFLIGI